MSVDHEEVSGYDIMGLMASYEQCEDVILRLKTALQMGDACGSP